MAVRLVLAAWALFLSAAAAAQNASDSSLPLATYIASNNSWEIIVPEVWNFTTILDVTGLSSIVQNYNTGNLSFPIDPPAIYVNGTYSAYASNAFNYAAQQDYNSSDFAYSDENWAFPVVCEWPISGMYCRLQRILFYCLLIFALIWRRHEWLIAGALAYATTFSGAAAIQAMVQFGVVNKYHDSAGDNDNEAILGILSASLLMAVPLINWSRTIRRLQARPILIYWVIIIFVGYILVIVANHETDNSDTWSRHAGGIMTCQTKEAIPKFTNLGFITHQFVSQYNCDDPCYNPNTMHPFHSSSSVVSRVVCDEWLWNVAPDMEEYACFTQCPRDIADNCWLEHSGWTRRDYNLLNVGYYGILPVASFELFFVLCFGRISPEGIRNIIFEFVVGKKLMQHYRALPISKRKNVKRTWRINIAWALGIVFYFIALLTYLVCVPFFFFNIGWQEWLLRLFPDGEDPFEVSQWISWVSIALAVSAAVVGKYHHHWRVYINHYVFGKKKAKSHPVQRTAEKEKATVSWIRRSTWRFVERARLEVEAFVDYWKHPFWLVLDTEREVTRDPPTVKYSLAGSFPFPGRAERYSWEHYQGPWNRSKKWQNFDIELFVQADDDTLRSWERYRRRYPAEPGADMRIVYDIDLPTVPTYPDKRTVMAEAECSGIVEKVGEEDPDAPNTGLRLTDAITPGASKASTVSYSLKESSESELSPTLRGSVDSAALQNYAMSGGRQPGRFSWAIDTNIPDARMSPIDRNWSPIWRRGTDRVPTAASNLNQQVSPTENEAVIDHLETRSEHMSSASSTKEASDSMEPNHERRTSQDHQQENKNHLLEQEQDHISEHRNERGQPSAAIHMPPAMSPSTSEHGVEEPLLAENESDEEARHGSD